MKSISIALNVGVAIRARRRGACMSQLGAADALGVSQGNYSRIETGKVVPNAVQLVLLAQAFRCHPGQFFR